MFCEDSVLSSVGLDRFSFSLLFAGSACEDPGLQIPKLCQPLAVGQSHFAPKCKAQRSIRSSILAIPPFVLVSLGSGTFHVLETSSPNKTAVLEGTGS